LGSVTPTTVEEVASVIQKLPNKTSPLDFLNTGILKECVDVFSPLLCHLANLSFREGRFPTDYKTAQVTPLLKKPGLDPNDPANYRPISNLNTIGKLLERLYLSRIVLHGLATGHFNHLQSAYRKSHSTETTLIKVLDDLYRTMEKKNTAAVLIGLDLSAAFDMVDHSILLQRLHDTFGFRDLALDWIRSYLGGRSQYVQVRSTRSAVTPVVLGVPQGSVLGPFLFSLYTSPISGVIESYGIGFHQYADDTQLYTAVVSSNHDEGIRQLELCCSAVRDWFSRNGMMLNPDKSEALLVGRKTVLGNLLNMKSVTVAGSPLHSSQSSRVWGSRWTQISLSAIMFRTL